MSKPTNIFHDPQKHAEGLRGLAHGLNEVLGDLGFCLIVFEKAKPGRADYISNCERTSMIEGLKETVMRLEGQMDFSVPSGN